MGAADFDRHFYAQPEKPAPPPRPPVPIVPLLLLAALGLGGFMLHELQKNGALSGAGGDTAQLARIEKRLDTLEHRLEQMEKRRKVSSSAEPAPPATQAQADAPAIHTDPPRSLPRTRTVYRISPPSRQEVVSSSASKPSPAPVGVSAQAFADTQSDVNALRHDVASNREEWEATTDRLGNVVGELGAERDEIALHQASLDQLSSRFRRNSLPFTLDRRQGRQQVGPVSLGLQSTDPKNQRYTMRLFVDDKSIELKDRVLHEAIQFYASGSHIPLELVVSAITKDSVKGRLALPQADSGH